MRAAVLWLGIVAASATASAATDKNATRTLAATACPGTKTSALLLLQDSDTGSSFLTQLLSGHECSQSWVEKGSRPDGHFRAKRSEELYKSLSWGSDRTLAGEPCVKGRVMEAHPHNIDILNGAGPGSSTKRGDRHVLVLLMRNPLFVALGQLKKEYYAATAKRDPKSNCQNVNQERLCHGLTGFTFPVDNFEKFDARVRNAASRMTEARAFTKKFSKRLKWPSAEVAYPELLNIEFVTGRALLPAPLLRHLGLVGQGSSAADECDARYAAKGVCVVPGDSNTLSDTGNHKSSPKNPMNQVTNIVELRAWANRTGAAWAPLLDLQSEVDAPLELEVGRAKARKGR
jgi:hypothetical protein